MAFIQNIGLANAPFKHQQMDILQFALEQYDIPERLIPKVERMYERSAINTRYSAIEDFSLPKAERTLFNNGQEPSINKRMNAYFEIAPHLCAQAAHKCLEQFDKKNITHLITVSCTGMAAPGLDVLLLEQLGLTKNIQRTSVNFMGCYAGFHALKMANAICAEQANAQVLILDVELCTLHFQKEFSMDNVASTLLFADGAAAILINNTKANSLFQIHSFYAELALEGKKDMAWDIGQTGFLMTLSGYIPDIIANNIQPLLRNAIGEQNEIKHWAIHPGGKKILNEIENALNLSSKALDTSRNILGQFGNMSSVTIFYVLHSLAQQKKHGEKVFAAGFGPGLTIESAILSYS